MRERCPGAALASWGPVLLIVHHSPTAATRELTEAVAAGAGDELIQGVGVVVRPALDAVADDVRAADAVVLGTSANFGYMSGALKHFFDAHFLRIGGALSDDGSATDGERLTRKPFGLYVHGRYDTGGAVRSVLAITGALPWQQSAAVLEVLGTIGAAEREAAYGLGATLAAVVAG